MPTSTTDTTQARQSRAAQHPPSPPGPHARRVALLDRLALRLGLALITWSRRRGAPESWERRASRVEQALAVAARERANERRARQLAPPR